MFNQSAKPPAVVFVDPKLCIRVFPLSYTPWECWAIWDIVSRHNSGLKVLSDRAFCFAIFSQVDASSFLAEIFPTCKLLEFRPGLGRCLGDFRRLTTSIVVLIPNCAYELWTIWSCDSTATEYQEIWATLSRNMRANLFLFAISCDGVAFLQFEATRWRI